MFELRRINPEPTGSFSLSELRPDILEMRQLRISAHGRYPAERLPRV
jgi:hypothetical protein